MLNNAQKCKTPKVVLLFDEYDDVSGAITIIYEDIKSFRPLERNYRTIPELNKHQPPVVIVALSSLVDSVEYYNDLVSKEVLNYPHQSILFCKSKDADIAFRCCLKGLFDNYFVYQPLYEKTRLKMIVHNGLQTTKKNDEYVETINQAYIGIDEELDTLIEDGSQCRKSLLASIDQCKSSLATASPYNGQPLAVDEQEIFDNFNKQRIEPLLNSLEENIYASIDGLLAQLQSQKDHLAASLIENHVNSQRIAQPKPLINEDSIKPKPLINAESIKPKPLINSESIKPNIPSNFQAINEQISSPERDKKTKHILVVEDNSIYREMISTVLTQHDYFVDQADDGLKALEKIESNVYDCIIMDLFMPNLDGFNTTKQVRKIHGKQDVPIVALTGNKKKVLLKKWAEAGINAYLVKPSNKDEILSVISKYTSNALVASP